MKITIVGAGDVGATVADNIARKELCHDLVMLDIKEGMTDGKAMDMMQSSVWLGSDTQITGSYNDYSKTAGSKVVVITSGIPRKPGMSREELVGINANIVKDVTGKILKESPDAIFVIISNPMDSMTYLTYKTLGIEKHRVIGMGGALDSSRFRYFLSKAIGCSVHDLNADVIGGHGDKTMIPLIRLATYNSIPVSDILSQEEMDEVVANTMVGGATLTKLIGTSAWYAPGAAGAMVVESIVRNEKKMIPCSVYLDGEYGQKDVCIGVPVVLGKDGWESIHDLPLNDQEKAKFAESADAIRKVNASLGL